MFILDAIGGVVGFVSWFFLVLYVFMKFWYGDAFWVYYERFSCWFVGFYGLEGKIRVYEEF